MATEITESNYQNLTYRPSINLQGYTCCGICRLKPGMICICCIIIIMTATQFLYLHLNDDKVIWWLWTYFGFSILFSIIAIFGICKYLYVITRIYAIWLIISLILTIIDEYLFGQHILMWYIIIAIMFIIRIYFVYIVWKYSKIVSLPYETLREISSGL